MKAIRISDEVWNIIAAHGKFGETENDVLERLLQVSKTNNTPPQALIVEKIPAATHEHVPKTARHVFANIKMSAEVRGKYLYVRFDHGPADNWQLPDISDKPSIRKVRDNAVSFAKQNGASFGQEQAVKKALTNAGYWLVK